MTTDEALLVQDKIRNLVTPAHLILQGLIAREKLYFGTRTAHGEDKVTIYKNALDALDKLCEWADSLLEEKP